MDILSQFILPAVLLYLLFQIFRVWLLYKGLKGIPIASKKRTKISRGELTADQSELVRTIEKDLEPLGFVFFMCVVSDFQDPITQAQFYNSESKCFASIALMAQAVESPFVWTSFQTIYEDDHCLLTPNWMSHLLEKSYPNSTILDPRLSNLVDVFHYHCLQAESLRQAHGDIKNLSTTELFDFDGAWEERHVEAMLAKRTAFRAADGCYRRLIPGLGHARRALKGELQKQQALKSLRPATSENLQPGTANTDARIRSEIEAFRKVESAQLRQRSSGKEKGFLLALSIVVFFASIELLGWEISATSLILVILVHELGHVLGMRLFGYKNLMILFVPFLGALASGKKLEVPVYQRIIVLLLGPVPGMAIGALLLLVPSIKESPFLLSTAGLFLLINYFNLLPIWPLDGGKVVTEIFFSRFVWLSTLFRVLGACFLGYFAYLSSFPLLYLLAALIMFGLRAQFTQDKLKKKFRKQTEKEDLNKLSEDELLQRVITFLYSTPHPRMSANAKFHLTGDILSHARVRTPGVLQMAFLLVLYFALLVGFIFPVATYFSIEANKTSTSIEHFEPKSSVSQRPEPTVH